MARTPVSQETLDFLLRMDNEREENNRRMVEVGKKILEEVDKLTPEERRADVDAAIKRLGLTIKKDKA